MEGQYFDGQDKLLVGFFGGWLAYATLFQHKEKQRKAVCEGHRVKGSLFAQKTKSIQNTGYQI